ncbi:MAG: hypothetical protein JO362_16150 [Streptomycetaceae bacterium]|nr:hypothetical protein [Streptomycetaceae bacterium]
MSSLRIRSAARALMHSALALSAAGAALAVGAGAAAAADNTDKTSGDVTGTAQALGPAIAPVTHLQLNPLGRTPVDPTTNGVGTQIADFKPISTRDVTKPLSDGDSLSQLPLAGKATQPFPG